MATRWQQCTLLLLWGARGVFVLWTPLGAHVRTRELLPCFIVKAREEASPDSARGAAESPGKGHVYTQVRTTAVLPVARPSL